MTALREYVVALAFTPGGKLVLMRKNRPAEQVGRWNGPGGAVRAGEMPSAAMSREFAEETGVLIPPHEWRMLVTLDQWDRSGPSSTLYFFTVTDDRVRECDTRTDEQVRRQPAEYWQQFGALGRHLDWLIPLARHWQEFDLPIEVCELMPVGPVEAALRERTAAETAPPYTPDARD